MSVTSPSVSMTLQEWDADESYPDQHVELVHGMPEVSPPERLGNRRITTRVVGLLLGALPPGWMPVTEVDVTVDAQAPTVRRPDVAVVSDAAPDAVGRHDPVLVSLVVEVVSPTSRARDWVTKQAEYAAAGIGAYLVIDPGRNVLALFSDPGPGGYATRTGDGGTAVWRLDGADILIRLDDLLGA